MSTQTGITPNATLTSFFGKCREGRVRLFKVVIANEELSLDLCLEARADWRRDWDEMVLAAVEDSKPCYIMYRLDERSATGYLWVLVCWSPDSSPVRQKMLYASTKATLKKEFGGGQIKDDLYANVREDVTLEGYLKHVISAAAPGPLSREELEREEIKQAQNDVAVSVDSKHQTMTGISFPLQRELDNAITEMAHRRLDYIQMSIDIQNEVVNLEEKCVRCGVPELKSKIPEGVPRYHLFHFKHSHEGDVVNSIVFIYTMPGYSCSIKERMLYSSCKNGLTDKIEHKGIILDKKIEVDSGEELTEEFLYSEIHPVKNLHKPKFAKPAPPNRGNRRITKPQV